MLDVLGRLVAGKWAQGGVVQDAPGHGILVLAIEGFPEIWLSGEDNAEDQTAIHLEVGQDAQHSEHIWSQIVRLVQEKHWAST
jgi:hypothetical protein